MSRTIGQSHCGASIGDNWVTDLAFAEDAVILSESFGVLVLALEAQHEETKPLVLQVSWTKTNVQAFGGLFDYTDIDIFNILHTLLTLLLPMMQ